MQMRRGVFQSDPILETLLNYYSSSGIMEPVPTGDPGPGNRPLGTLAVVTTAVLCSTPPLCRHTNITPNQVEHAYKMHVTGDFISSAQQFGADFWGPSTVQYMDYIINDLSEQHWNSIFDALSSFSTQKENEEAVRNSVSEESHERVPLPPSDPPSPPRD